MPEEHAGGTDRSTSRRTLVEADSTVVEDVTWKKPARSEEESFVFHGGLPAGAPTERNALV